MNKLSSPTTEAPATKAEWTNQRYRLDRVTTQLIEGMAIVEAEHPDSTSEWRARWLGGWLAETILAMGMGIEQQARDEGRREAVRDAIPKVALALYDANYHMSHEEADEAARSILNVEGRVAGLNASESPLRWEDGEPFPMGDASESPPTRCCLDCIDEAGDKCEHPGCLCHASESPPTHMRQSGNGCVTCPRRWSDHTAAERRDASESSPMDPAFAHDAGPNAYPDDFPGDASDD